MRVALSLVLIAACYRAPATTKPAGGSALVLALDGDRDSVVDDDDRCPTIPEDRDGFEDADGCPEGNRNDRDGDNVLDEVDSCPDEPEDVDGFQDTDGCPDPDNDGDGLADAVDLCPNDPEDKDGVQDADGCPEP